MKKIFTLLIMLTAFLLAGNAQTFVTIESGVVGMNGTSAAGISPDGKYVTGSVLAMDQAGNSSASHHMFRWTKDGGIEEWDAANANEIGQGSIGKAVINDGMVIGVTPDPNTTAPYNSDNPDLILPVITAAYSHFNNNASWEILAFTDAKKETGISYGYGDEAYAGRSNYGYTTIVGTTTSGGASEKKIPIVWEFYYNEDEGGKGPTDIRILPAPDSHQGAAVLAVDGAGKFAGGWSGGGPALWNLWDYPATMVSLKGASGSGEIFGISNNGKYAALMLNNTAAFYDIEEQIMVYAEENNSSRSRGLAISNNGIMVGHWGDVTYTEGDTRRAFIYTEARGMMRLADFFDEFEVEYPSGFTFKAVTGISADGSKIVGYGLYSGKMTGFYAEIPPITGGIYAPRGITLENNSYGIVNINWIPVGNSTGLTGYRIYHNGALLETAQPDATTYAHNISEDGEHEYYVKAVYGDTESKATKTKKIVMGKRDFPFYDPFDYEPSGYFGSGIPLSTGFWDVTVNFVATQNDSWVPGPSGYPPNCAFFFPPAAGYYEESMTSAFIDASTAEKIYLDFTLNVSGVSEGEKLAISMFDGENWIGLDTIPAIAFNYNEWKQMRYEVPEAAGKNNIRVRFTCFGEGTGVDINWNVDNVSVSNVPGGVSLDPPIVVGATEDKEHEAVYVNWADPRGFVKLRYLYSDEWNVGMVAEETPFIAANKYNAEDLAIYKDYKLTSLSFMPGEATNAKYIWYVMQDGNRLFSAEVEGVVTAREYTTITLDTPIDIDVTKDLYYGVEVKPADERQPVEGYPIATCDNQKRVMVGDIIQLHSVNMAAGRGNIYSKDGGETWIELESYMYYDEEFGFEAEIFPLFPVKATLAKDPSAEPHDRFMRFEVYRDQIKIIDEFFGEPIHSSLTTFVDIEPVPVGQEACYEIYSYYRTGDVSEPITVCITREGSVNIESSEADNSLIKVYPNPASDFINIEGQFSSAELYNVNGQRVIESTDRKVSLSSIPAGVYYLKINTETGIITQKVIVK